MTRKAILGIAAGAAAVGTALYLLKKRADRREFESHAADAKENFKGKLNELQRKASKEVKNVTAETKEAVNAAKDRANDWVNNTAQA